MTATTKLNMLLNINKHNTLHRKNYVFLFFKHFVLPILYNYFIDDSDDAIGYNRHHTPGMS